MTPSLVATNRLLSPGATAPLWLAHRAVIWLLAETAALVMCLGLWIISGFGGRLHSEPYQLRHYAIMRWFLDLLFHSAQRVFGLRVEDTEPALDDTEAAARLARPVIVLSRHAGPGDSFLLVRHLLSTSSGTGCLTCSYHTGVLENRFSLSRSHGSPAGSGRPVRW